MSPENAHKLIIIYMGGLILGVNTLYMLSCFLKQFALVGKGLMLRFWTTNLKFTVSAESSAKSFLPAAADSKLAQDPVSMYRASFGV